MRNDGKDAERAFESYWSKKGHVERLRDRRDLIGLNGGNTKIADFKKPSDFLVSAPLVGLHYAEVKSTINGNSFQFSKIQDGQHKAAMLEASRGIGAYTFYIFSYELGSWFTMSCVQYKGLIDAGRKSVMFEELKPWKML